MREELQKSQELVVGGSLDLKRKKKVSYAKAEEFMKMLKRSEYSVVEQLKKAPAQIFIWSLLMSSEARRNALLKMLNEGVDYWNICSNIITFIRRAYLIKDEPY